ncbi:MAG: pantoate--beta-alanine ligase [Melioribacteraceae bacterium]|nr:pantoate--beta-alanine ligase [Melioribacteraceae bacterium]
MPKIVSRIKEMQRLSKSFKIIGKKVGFVPTMGYLHDGHLSLVRKAKAACDIVVVSIFVNPTQFSPNEDLEKYPRDFERDSALLKNEGVDIIFYPSVNEMYADGAQTFVDVANITQKFEGESRPTHFRGVSTVVTILFNAVQPDVAVFGQKDAQQAAVIKRMAKDLHFDIDIIVAPIVREADGLAMSSRNIYLSGQERKDALTLSKSLAVAETLINKGETEAEKIISKMKNLFAVIESSRLEYIKVVESCSFEEVKTLENGKEYFFLIACKVGKTRLIDNLLITA